MAKKTVQPRKRRGPPATGKGTPIQVRLQKEALDKLDAWRATLPKESGKEISRPEAIRRLIGKLVTGEQGWLDHAAEQMKKTR